MPAKSSHCPLCSAARRCGKYHLYVVELDYDLVKNWKFIEVNPGHKTGMDCLYVGSTSHTPVCRFAQHRMHAKKRTLGYECLCDGKETFREFVRGGGHTRGSYYPGVYGLRLRPDLYFSLNPIPSQKAAFAAEEKLASRLRRLGYAVWQH